MIMITLSFFEDWANGVETNSMSETISPQEDRRLDRERDGTPPAPSPVRPSPLLSSLPGLACGLGSSLSPPPSTKPGPRGISRRALSQEHRRPDSGCRFLNLEWVVSPF
ncbi:hypothetical protein NL676_018784 [Syzygium grande]|nr:hypothetical protein NL676_018784 [Syzygium grande]